MLDLVGGSLEYRHYLDDRLENAPHDAEPHPRVLDDKVLEIAKQIAAPVSLSDIKAMTPTECRPVLCKMRKSGLTVNQIVRAVGLGRATIANGTSGWRDM